jgi:hypothetical protein
MSFLHATATRKQKYLEEGNLEGVAKLPIITCFERSASPGGVWRSNDKDEPITKAVVDAVLEEDQTDEDQSLSSHDLSSDVIVDRAGTSSTKMYEALWTNGPKESIEYFDYTFEEHFQRDLPVFMRRNDLLDYMIARVTRKNPSFFDSVKFHTSVLNVIYADQMEKFEVTIEDTVTSERSVHYFDKCIWAAGNNGLTKIPRPVHTILQEGKYAGLMMHSSAAGNHLSSFRGKEIVMFGDSYSAEDLALQAIKLGVGKIHIIPRTGGGICCEMDTWPQNKVKIHKYTSLSKVISEGTGLRLIETYWNHEKNMAKTVPNGKTFDIEHVAAVIYCTGYHGNYDMIQYSEEDEDDEVFQLPKKMLKTWKMTENVWTKYVGHIKPCKLIATDYLGVTLGYHNCVTLSNPNLMHLCECSDSPLFEIDIFSWVLLKHVMGEMHVPTLAEQKKAVQKLVVEAMDIPCSRYVIDVKYRQAIYDQNRTIDLWDEEVSGFDFKTESIRHEILKLKMLGHVMKEGDYPVNILTPDGELNEIGNRMIEINFESYVSRLNLSDYPEEEQEWRTFRDLKNTDGFRSIHTGAVAVPFKKKWLDLKDDEDVY